jgi:hypothetical protein
MEQRMQNSSFEVINLSLESARAESYDNYPVARVNDHEVRISIMTGGLSLALSSRLR